MEGGNTAAEKEAKPKEGRAERGRISGGGKAERER